VPLKGVSVKEVSEKGVALKRMSVKGVLVKGMSEKRSRGERGVGEKKCR
jgi:hypothetical protein